MKEVVVRQESSVQSKMRDEVRRMYLTMHAVISCLSMSELVYRAIYALCPHVLFRKR